MLPLPLTFPLVRGVERETKWAAKLFFAFCFLFLSPLVLVCLFCCVMPRTDVVLLENWGVEWVEMRGKVLLRLGAVESGFGRPTAFI